MQIEGQTRTYTVQLFTLTRRDAILARILIRHIFVATRTFQNELMGALANILKEIALGQTIALTAPSMDALTAAAASGMRSRMDSLDMLANNIANSSSPGYKGDREFYSTYLAAEATMAPDDIGSVMPVIERPWTDLSQGSLTSTGNPLDVALRGKGFFVAISDSGPLLTRDGNFKLSLKGELETQDGMPVRGQDGKPIQVDPTKPVEITPEGEVRQDKQSLGTIDVIDVKDAGALSKRGASYFGFSASDVIPAADPQVQQGNLELANFQPAESAVRLVSVMRQFEMLQRAVSIGSDMSRRVIEEVAKVTG